MPDPSRCPESRALFPATVCITPISSVSLWNIWEWKATSTNVVGFMDDDHFGPPVEATSEQLEGKFPYRGGFAVDPGTAGYKDNFEQEESNTYNKVVTPRRVPKDIATTTAALGKVDLDPNHGESDGAKWFMTEEEINAVFTRAQRQNPCWYRGARGDCLGHVLW